MPVYSVEGKLGTGKTLFAVWRAQEALLTGRRVASNVDLNCEVLVPVRGANYIRLPDKPSSFDLHSIGQGNPDSYDEDRNGVLILDELGTWLNSRSFQDKDRAAVLDWLIHARKFGWDVYLIVQDANMIDRQVRESLIELQVRCMRGDKVKIPILGWVLSCLHPKWGYLPKFHWATARIGYGANAIVAERWFYKAKELYDAYDTRQVFRADYPHGAHSVLMPWTWSRPGPSRSARIYAWVRAFVLGLVGRGTSVALDGLDPKPRSRAMALVALLPTASERIYWAKRLNAI